jgi:hypothetical protein
MVARTSKELVDIGNVINTSRTTILLDQLEDNIFSETPMLDWLRNYDGSNRHWLAPPKKMVEFWHTKRGKVVRRSLYRAFGGKKGFSETFGSD